VEPGHPSVARSVVAALGLQGAPRVLDIGTGPGALVDTGLDSPETIGALFTAGGLEPHRIWLERLTHRWEPSTYWRLVTGTGANRARLLLADEDGRAALLATARPRLEALDPEDFAWWGEVICAVASKPG
jgi:hypothetical protein